MLCWCQVRLFDSVMAKSDLHSQQRRPWGLEADEGEGQADHGACFHVRPLPQGRVAGHSRTWG